MNLYFYFILEFILLFTFYTWKHLPLLKKVTFHLCQIRKQYLMYNNDNTIQCIVTINVMYDLRCQSSLEYYMSIADSSIIESSIHFTVETLCFHTWKHINLLKLCFFTCVTYAMRNCTTGKIKLCVVCQVLYVVFLLNTGIVYSIPRKGFDSVILLKMKDHATSA